MGGDVDVGGRTPLMVRRGFVSKPLNDRVLPHDPNMHKTRCKMFLLLACVVALFEVGDLARRVRESMQGGVCDESPTLPSPEQGGRSTPNWGGIAFESYRDGGALQLAQPRRSSDPTCHLCVERRHRDKQFIYGLGDLSNPLTPEQLLDQVFP